MKLKLSTLAVCCMTAAMPATQAATVLIDWSDSNTAASPDTNMNTWNTIGVNTLVTNLTDSSNSATTWDVQVTHNGGNIGTTIGFGGTGINGPVGATAPFDTTGANRPTVDGMFISNGAGTNTITFFELATNTQYDFSLIGGRAAGGNDSIIAVTTGTGSAGNLLDDGTILNFSVTSTAGGVIAFNYSSPGLNSTFNAMSITVVPEPSSAALLGLGGLALILRRRK